ncbi:MAG: DNA polymerase III subunit alpha [Thermodesulfobacteriota bacterium]
MGIDMQHSGFIHLHLHTKYSLLDGAIRMNELFALAREYKMPALAMTDHGNMFGTIEFYTKAYQNGIKPIIGCEVYVAPGSRFNKESRGISDASYHLTLLVKNTTGYKNLLKLVTAAYFEGFYYRPRVDKDLLKNHNEGLIALSGCLHGELSRLIEIGDKENALKVASEYKEIFNNGRFYLEIQDNKIELQKSVNEGLIEISRILDLPLVATNDCHYLKREDSKAHEVLLCIQTGKILSDQDRMRFATDEFYFKSPAEMDALFSSYPDALKNTIEIAERCNLELRFDELHLPDFKVPQGESLDSYLEKTARDGLKERIKLIEAGVGDVSAISDKYYKRLEEELNTIKAMGFSGYFLIVSDFVNYAKKRNIPVGPGRGSAAGSLVAYSLKITDIDPLLYDLLFERFLNPGRISMPDIDIDFCVDGRDDTIEYVANKYGRKNVAQIITFGKMQAKGVVRDVGRVLNMPYKEVDRIAKLIPNTPNTSLEDALRQEPKLKELEQNDENVRHLISLAKSLEGLPRHASTHAAGVVIANKPLVEYLPLYKGQNGEVVTQFAMNDVGKIGLIKFDFLGLKTLTLIDNALRIINEGKEEKLDLNRIPLDDELTYRLLGAGDTSGVFQLESSGMKELLIKLKPGNIEDVIALLALYRPGPLGSGMVDDFIKRKHGTVPVKYEVPQLEGVLKDTYGVIVYQEQVMKIASTLANFTLGDADLLRRAMGKKKPEEMAKQKEKFLLGAKKNKIKTEKAEKIFDLMAMFAEYGFNKSHSAAYAMIAYQTAYLKAHYPIEFMAALLTSEKENTDKLIRYITECNDKGIQVLPPDINESFRDFTVIDGRIRFGLAGVKNVGNQAIEAIISIREKDGKFNSIFDFCERVDARKANRRVVESLIKCGTFDFTGVFRSKLMGVLDDAIERAGAIQRDRTNGQINMFDIFNDPGAVELNAKFPDVEEWHENQLLTYEKEVLGFYITGHPLTRYEEDIKRYANTNTLDIVEFHDGAEIKIGGMVSSVREINTRKGDRMARVTLEDLKGFIEIVVFPDIYKETSSFLKGEEPILILGTLAMEEENPKVIAKKIIPLSEAKEKLNVGIHFTVKTSSVTREHLEKLRDILLNHKGNSEAFLHLVLPNFIETVISLGEEFRLTPSEVLFKKVEELFGCQVAS